MQLYIKKPDSNIYNLNYEKQKQAATLAYRSTHKMASPQLYQKGWDRSMHQSRLYLAQWSMGRGGEKEKHTSVGWGRQSLRHTKPLEQDIRTGAHHRYLFGHHYGNNISRKKMKKNTFTYSKDNKSPFTIEDPNMYILQSLSSREYKRNEIENNQRTKRKTAFVVFGMHIAVQQKANWYCSKHWFVWEGNKKKRMTELSQSTSFGKLTATSVWVQQSCLSWTDKQETLWHIKTDKKPAEGFWAELIQNSLVVFYFRCRVNAWGGGEIMTNIWKDTVIFWIRVKKNSRTLKETKTLMESSPTYQFVYNRIKRGAVHQQHHRYHYSL